jgi:hypothetical protein
MKAALRFGLRAPLAGILFDPVEGDTVVFLDRECDQERRQYISDGLGLCIAHFAPVILKIGKSIWIASQRVYDGIKCGVTSSGCASLTTASVNSLDSLIVRIN